MLKATLISATLLGGGATFVGVNEANFTTNELTKESSTTAPKSSKSSNANNATLWGIYGKHNLHDCPVNDKARAQWVVNASKADLKPLFEKYGIVEFKDRYHSGLEHTFVWVVETTRPYDLQAFAIELGIAQWNDLTFVPVFTFEDHVVPMVAKLHNID